MGRGDARRGTGSGSEIKHLIWTTQLYSTIWDQETGWEGEMNEPRASERAKGLHFISLASASGFLHSKLLYFIFFVLFPFLQPTDGRRRGGRGGRRGLLRMLGRLFM